MLPLLISTALFAALPGCSPAPRQEQVSYTLHTAVTPCARPQPLDLAPLDTGKRLEHPVNLALLTLSIDLMAEQLADMDATLQCYETQTGRSK